MNAQDYISSGLLEAYVLGALSDAEFEQVAGAICRFPEVRREVALMEESLFEAAAAQAVAPPPALQDAIWAQLEAQHRPEAAAATVQTTSKSIPLPPPAHAAPGTSPRRKIFPLGMAAAVAVLVASLSANYFIFRNGREQVRYVSIENQHLNTELQEQKEKLARFEHESDMAASPDMQMVAMRSLKPGESMAATMYWNAAKQSAYVSVHRLPTPPEGMQYQLWAIADGKPVSLGMIDNAIAADGGMQEVELPVAAGQAFAVSLEKAGGVPSPTADQIMLLGKVPA